MSHCVDQSLALTPGSIGGVATPVGNGWVADVVSPDGTTFVPAGEDFITGRLYYGSKLHDVLRAFGMAAAIPGKPFYVSDEEELQTYRATIDDAGTLTDVKLFAEAGGEFGGAGIEREHAEIIAVEHGLALVWRGGIPERD